MPFNESDNRVVFGERGDEVHIVTRSKNSKERDDSGVSQVRPEKGFGFNALHPRGLG